MTGDVDCISQRDSSEPILMRHGDLILANSVCEFTADDFLLDHDCNTAFAQLQSEMLPQLNSISNVMRQLRMGKLVEPTKIMFGSDSQPLVSPRVIFFLSFFLGT